MREALRSLLTSTSSRHRPRQMAAAIALGVCVGLIPLSSPLFYLLLACIYLLPVHLPLAWLCTGLVSLFAVSLQATLGQIGMRSLSHPYLMEMWLQVDAYPLVPWLGLHNTVVNGGALVGLSLLMPVYLFTRPIAVWVYGVDRLEAEALAQVHQVQALAEPNAMTAEEAPALELADAPVRIRDAAPTIEAMPELPACQTASEIAFSELSRLLNTDGQYAMEAADTHAVIERAAKVAALVDEMLSLVDLEDFDVAAHNDSTTPTETVAENLVESEQQTAEPTNESRDNSWRLDTPLLTNSARQASSVANEANVPTDGGSVTEDISPAAARPVHTKLFQADGTVIEVLRRPRYQSSSPADRVSTSSPKTLAEVEMIEVPSSGLEHLPSVATTNSGGESAPVATDAQAEMSVPASNSLTREQHRSDRQARRDEALRYLLHHLHEQKQKV